eukprot:CAMPEP_0115864728 /NCGR_PEP_ID=MMETSP0287-20121206/19350_1 /TAXON_ID=412157 /ORGANISM="Chrysochromulina rotalis, Strain UIO044" /LENGTH=91 /DNA_ID=CAMNT_0003319207 /DNA_START=112 /DNA_END=387 /DNA_ORIENTATION=-
MRTSMPSQKFPVSTREVAAKKFLSNEHVKKDNPSISPGPAKYDQKPVATGPQASTRIRNSPSYGFGTADRFNNARNAAHSAASPGPGAYLV